jgi:two-component system LytT family response regulator
MNLNCLIVDDEPIARNGLAGDIKEFDFLTVVGLAENAFQAIQFLNGGEPVDLLFLDIDMPGLSGLDFLKLVRVKPIVIITTAYPQYAINGFELGVIDYLLKPISMDRLETEINKANKWLFLNLYDLD